ncbi:MAG TPA: bifunctional phosphopantothenoylcysteine decarboxylase/phosphopantothenate--cysteine ligase CoaBC [Ferruginibacter sp.]|nr:bifunctional phosphopantothenoylcysteine decarboxylase/phosphopantothenate--cysteine ligase CoaBC [Ferruginibacter sp.]
MLLQGKKILLGVSGSIAAYKAAVLVRLLIKEGAEVRVIMTKASQDFVTPLTLSTLSRNEVLYQISDNATWANHVMLGRWADIMLIAPLSCNSLAKMAHGVCDNLLMAVYLSCTCPVAVAPAMDEDMWKHQSTVANINTIQSYGNFVLNVNTGELASGLTGEGRMAEPEEILHWLSEYFQKKKELRNKNVLITAGPTYEHIDPVRFIGNYSSGKMGIALATEAYSRGANVTLLLGPSAEPVPHGIELVRVQTANEMFEQCSSKFPNANIAILSAAVADYAPAQVAKEKIKKSDESLTLELKKTPDILKYLGTVKKEGQFLAGFALETHNEKENALKKLKQKNADIIILNSLADKGAGFGHNSNKITIFDNKGKEIAFELKSKEQVAKDILDTIISYTHA